MNAWAFLLSAAGHHGEAADPDLLEWIKGFLDHAFDPGAWTVVAILGLLIVSIPIGITVFYLWQQGRRPGRDAQKPQDSVSGDAP